MIIKEMVNELIKKYKTRNPYELCESLNIKVMYEELGSLNGFYQSAPKNRIIHLNNSLSENDMLFTCAHELGHAILHTNLNILFLEKHTNHVKGKYELEADIFASELIIKESLLDKYENFCINTIANTEGINIKYLNYKFNRQ